MAATIHLLRHGRTQGFRVRRYIGRTDVPLDDLGRELAVRWREHFGPGRFSRILCSDLARSLDTARILGGQETKPEILTALREIDLGDWDGLDMDRVRSEFPDQYTARGLDMAGYRPPGGESFNDLQQRVVPVVRALAREAHGDVLVAGHAGVNRAILCHALAMPLEHLFRLSQDHAGLSVIHWNPGAPRVLCMNLLPENPSTP